MRISCDLLMLSYISLLVLLYVPTNCSAGGERGGAFNIMYLHLNVLGILILSLYL